MATTENGIYYPTDGTQPADVLSDMKKMAESIDETINDNTYDDTKIKEDISKIKKEQETQNKIIEKNAENIEDNATDIQDLKEENANLKAQIPKGQATGEEISLRDSAEMELVDFSLQGNSKQAIREGYNLLPPFSSTVLNGITYTKNEDGTITVNGTASADSFYRQNINLEEGDYYLSGSPTGGANNTYFLQAMGYGEAGNDYGSGTTFKVTTSSSVGIRIMIYQGVTVNNLVFKPMIVKGTEKKDYEQYGVSPSLDYPSEVEAVGDSGSVEIIKSNKNIFEETSNLEGVTTAFTSIVKGNFRLKKDVYYTISFNTNNNGGKVYLNEDIFADVSRLNFDGNRKYITTKIKDGVEEIYKNATLLKTYEAVNIPYEISNIQIASNNDIDFIEHKGNTYTLPIQKPFLKGDYFVKEDNQWKEVHLRGKRNIKDDIQNAVLSVTNNFIYISNLLLNIAQPITNEVDANVLSNVLNHATYNEINAGSVDYGIGISQVGSLIIRIKDFTTLEEYKNALNSEDYYYYFFLANPEKIECTKEQTQILEQIIKDGTYKGITHFYTTNDLKPEIEITYYKDLETLFKNQEQMQATLDNVQAQLLDLGGN